MRLLPLFLLLLSGHAVEAQLRELSRIGQSHGGAAFHVNYDSASKRLFAGCGTSVWIYDASDTNDIRIVAKRSLLGLVNETDLYHNVLFAAATHDGLWALDTGTPTLEPLAHYPLAGDSAAYDLWRSNDTLFLADGRRIRMLRYDRATGFHLLRSFGTAQAICVARKGDLVAVGSRFLLSGTVSVYHAGNLDSPIATWSHGTIYNIQDLQFADGRNDILYVCGGSNDFGFTGQFYALHLAGDSLAEVGHYTINGIFGYAMAVMLNMDSRNDTLFLATTAGLLEGWSAIPVLDASRLPDDSLRYIGLIRPGLWYFDVALMRGTPYLAIASEWLGVMISNVSQLAPVDTLGFLATGGWTDRSVLMGDTLWLCNRGYGLAAHRLNDLYFSSGYVPTTEILHIFTQFVGDFTTIDDSLVVLNTTEVYNLNPWRMGGTPVFVTSLQSESWGGVRRIRTENGDRIVAGQAGLKNLKLMEFKENTYRTLHMIGIGHDASGLFVSGDTILVGATIDGTSHIAAYTVEGDTLAFIASVATPGDVIRIAKEAETIAVACGNAGCAWYRFTHGVFTELGSMTGLTHNTSGVALRNGFLHVAHRTEGVRVYDISQPAQPVLVAVSRGTGGWQGQFGSTNIEVGPDGTIYLADFHAGVIIIEPYDGTSGLEEQRDASARLPHLRVYPHPVTTEGTIVIECGDDPGDTELVLYDLLGREARRFQLTRGQREIRIARGTLRPGLYAVRASTGNRWIAHATFIIQ